MSNERKREDLDIEKVKEGEGERERAVFLGLAPLCRYPNTHPNPLQNPIGVCVPVYKRERDFLRGTVYAPAIK